MAGKIPGALLGLFVGHMFDRGYSQDFSQMGGFGRFFTDTGNIKQQTIFFHTLFATLGHLAKSDGAVTSAEIQIATNLMDEMALQGEDRKAAQNAFREGKASDYPIKESIEEFVDSVHGRRDILQIFLEILIQAPFADGVLSTKELAVLEKVAANLGFKYKELHYLISMYEAEIRFKQGSRRKHSSNRQRQQATEYTQQQRLNDAYKILGVDKSAQNADVKKAYRKLMATHHPDKLISKGLPEQAMKIAKNKAQDIQAAYELIKKERGI